MLSRICTSLILLSLLLASYARDNIVPVDNLPADSTITQIELENYINKTHIALLNRKPTQAELTQSLQQLDVDRYNRTIRDTYVLGIQDLDRSKWAIWQFLSDRILDGIDTTQVRESADIFQACQTSSDTLPPICLAYRAHNRPRLGLAIYVKSLAKGLFPQLGIKPSTS